MEKLNNEEDMHKFIGTEVSLFLKSDKQLRGLLIDTDQEYSFIQAGLKVLVVPKENIEYYETVGFVNNIKADNKNISSNKGYTIRVSIDGVFICGVAISPDVNIASCTTEIVDIVLGNDEIQKALTGKVMKTIAYDVGAMNILTNIPFQTPVKQSNTFTFSPNVVSESLSPIDFVTGKR